jgi:multidrug efflux pump subunit AcrA (membrane-fusion protein)
MLRKQDTRRFARPHAARNRVTQGKGTTPPTAENLPRYPDPRLSDDDLEDVLAALLGTEDAGAADTGAPAGAAVTTSHRSHDPLDDILGSSPGETLGEEEDPFGDFESDLTDMLLGTDIDDDDAEDDVPSGRKRPPPSGMTTAAQDETRALLEDLLSSAPPVAAPVDDSGTGTWHDAGLPSDSPPDMATGETVTTGHTVIDRPGSLNTGLILSSSSRFDPAAADSSPSLQTQPPERTRARRRQEPTGGRDDGSIEALFAEQDIPFAPDKPARRRSAGMDDLDRLLQVGTGKPTVASKWRARIVWAAILGGLVWLAFLPYAFEVGGDFVIQPIDRAEARTRTDGEVTAINVAQGDWVEKDQILAVISNWDEERDVVLNESDDERLRAELATLTHGARPEQIKVAEEALSTADVQVEITARDLARQERLYALGTIPEKEMLDARDAHEVAVAMRNQAQANLDLVKSGAQQTEIDAQLAAIARNDEELSYARLMLEYTNVRAPVAGQIVSDMTKVPVGAYLATGSLFAQIENNSTVIAEIELPEITIEEVQVGAQAELRLWSEPERSIFGTVRAIAPRAEESEFGPVIKVQVEVPNPDGDLSANMSGFGKITAGERPAWEVFSRAVYRFLTIEVWSWLP